MIKVEELTNKIKNHFTCIKELEEERRKICNHKNIIMDSYCQDEWAFPNDYTTTYKCKDCGLFVSSNNPNKNYDKLNELYKKKLIKE